MDTEISVQLESSTVGIFCLTPENVDSRWLNYEAGAIATNPKDKTYVCTYLFGFASLTDLGLPLSRFQGTLGNKDDTKKLLENINSKLDNPLTKDLLTETFEKWWPDFEAILDEVLKMPAAKPPAPRETVSLLAREARPISSFFPVGDVTGRPGADTFPVGDTGRPWAATFPVGEVGRHPRAAFRFI